MQIETQARYFFSFESDGIASYLGGGQSLISCWL